MHAKLTRLPNDLRKDTFVSAFRATITNPWRVFRIMMRPRLIKRTEKFRKNQRGKTFISLCIIIQSGQLNFSFKSEKIHKLSFVERILISQIIYYI